MIIFYLGVNKAVCNFTRVINKSDCRILLQKKLVGIFFVNNTFLFPIWKMIYMQSNTLQLYLLYFILFLCTCRRGHYKCSLLLPFLCITFNLSPCPSQDSSSLSIMQRHFYFGLPLFLFSLQVSIEEISLLCYLFVFS